MHESGGVDVTAAARPTGLFVGLSTLDVIQLVEHVPGPDEKIPALDVSIAAGGPATNAAVAFAALGGHAVLVTRVSADAVGSLVRADLDACGVLLRNIGGGDFTTATATILVTRSTGDRAVVSAADHGRSGITDSVDALAVMDEVGPDVVVIDSYETDLSGPLAALAATRGIPVVLDCGGKKEYTPNQLASVSVAVVSDYYLPDGPQAIEADIRLSGVPYGAITGGAAPIHFWTPTSDGPQSVVPPKVVAVDTLGAGDFFHGALAFRLGSGRGRDDDFADALSFAAHVSSVSVQYFGSRSWLAHIPEQLRVQEG